MKIPGWYAEVLIGRVALAGWTPADVDAAIDESCELDRRADDVVADFAASHRIIRGAVVRAPEPGADV